MKYDIAKNEDGPLRKTLQGRKETPATASGRETEQSSSRAGQIPGLDERLRNIEAHLAVRYGQLAIAAPPFRTVTDTCSPISAGFLFGSIEVPRGSYHSIRERVPTLGRPALQSTSSWCMFINLPFVTRPTLLTLRLYSGHLRRGQHLLLSLLASRLPLKTRVYRTATSRRQPRKLLRIQHLSPEVSYPN